MQNPMNPQQGIPPEAVGGILSQVAQDIDNMPEIIKTLSSKLEPLKFQVQQSQLGFERLKQALERAESEAEASAIRLQYLSTLIAEEYLAWKKETAQPAKEGEKPENGAPIEPAVAPKEAKAGKASGKA